jgi:hypothetical protein
MFVVETKHSCAKFALLLAILKWESIMSWAKEDFALADLVDKRLNKRLIKLVE